MYLIVVYDTEQKNCVKLHKQLKKYLNWNQNSVFEGTVTVSQYARIKSLLEKERTENSHVVLFSLENDKFLTREELGTPKGNISNIL